MAALVRALPVADGDAEPELELEADTPVGPEPRADGVYKNKGRYNQHLGSIIAYPDGHSTSAQSADSTEPPVPNQLTGIEPEPEPLLLVAVRLTPVPTDAEPEPDADADAEGVVETDAFMELEREGELLTLLADDAPEAIKLPPMVDTGVHIDEAGAGCAGGVTGSPWWKVEAPYTPMGCYVASAVGCMWNDVALWAMQEIRHEGNSGT